MDYPTSALLAFAARHRDAVCTLGADVPAELPMPEPESGTWWEYVTGFGWVERRPVEVEPVAAPLRRESAAA